MSERTPWFSGSTPPVRPGMYEVRRRTGSGRWERRNRYVLALSIMIAMMGSDWQWRGLTRPAEAQR